jgi:hypothetical protein
MPSLTKEIIEAAIGGFETQKQHIDAQISELRAMLNGRPSAPLTERKARKGRRKLSREALQRMREGQQRRWAKVRGESAIPSEVASQASKPKRKLSAAGKAAIVAALKKRWAAKKAATTAIPVVPMAKKTGRKKAS